MLNASRRYMADFDFALLSLAVGLAASGVLEIWSVTTTHGMAPGLWRRQLAGVGIGLVGKMGLPRLERGTYCLGGSRSIHLSYKP
jgi:hypothetical protein